MVEAEHHAAVHGAESGKHADRGRHGYLDRRAGDRGQWERRFFRMHDHHLLEYKDVHGACAHELLASVDLSAAGDITADGDAGAAILIKVADGVPLALRASSVEDAAAWLAVLRSRQHVALKSASEQEVGDGELRHMLAAAEAGDSPQGQELGTGAGAGHSGRTYAVQLGAGALGIVFAPKQGCVSVRSAGGQAKAAGVQRGDTIVAVGGVAVAPRATHRDVVTMIMRAGRPLDVQLRREPAEARAAREAAERVRHEASEAVRRAHERREQRREEEARARETHGPKAWEGVLHSAPSATLLAAQESEFAPGSQHFNEGSDGEPCSSDATRVAIHNALCILARLIQADYTGAAASRAWSQRVVADYCAALGRKDFAGALRVAETAALDTRYKELVVVYTFHGRGVPFAHVLQGSPGDTVDARKRFKAVAIVTLANKMRADDEPDVESSSESGSDEDVTLCEDKAGDGGKSKSDVSASSSSDEDDDEDDDENGGKGKGKALPAFGTR
eukprot:g548.t1